MWSVVCFCLDRFSGGNPEVLKAMVAGGNLGTLCVIMTCDSTLFREYQWANFIRTFESYTSHKNKQTNNKLECHLIRFLVFIWIYWWILNYYSFLGRKSGKGFFVYTGKGGKREVSRTFSLTLVAWPAFSGGG